MSDKRLPVLKRSETPVPYHHRPMHDFFIEALVTFRLMSVEQLNAWAGRSEGSLQLTRQDISQLFHAHLLNCVYDKSPSQAPGGGARRIYLLDRLGRQKARSLGF